MHPYRIELNETHIHPLVMGGEDIIWSQLQHFMFEKNGFKQLPGMEENKIFQGQFKYVLKAACMITSMKMTKSLTNKVQIIIIKKINKVQIIETNT